MSFNGVAARGAVIAIAAALSACQGGESTHAAPVPTKPEPAVKLDLYTMSKCPYGTKAATAVSELMELFGDSVGFRIDYIGINLTKSDRPFASLHGEEEVQGDLIQLCAAKASPKAHPKLLRCMNERFQEVPKGWEACADKAGIDADTISGCVDGGDGRKLLFDSFKRAHDAQAISSPTILINGKPFPMEPAKPVLMRAICQAFPAEKRPPACAKLAAAPKVTVTILTDERCKDCKVDMIVARLKGAFPGLDSRVLDWSDEEAKQIASTAGIERLPAVLFDASLKNEPEEAAKLARWLTDRGPYKSLATPAFFDPSSEICDNGADDTGDGRADCQDPACAESLPCRPERKGALGLFVMSRCPYGRQATEALRVLLPLFGAEVAFDLRFVVEELDGKFRSMNGEQEVAEDLREVCAREIYRKDNAYLKYVWCRGTQASNEDWRACATESGVEPAAIEACVTGGKGAKLLTADARLTEALKIAGSPMWLVDNKHVFPGVNAATVQKHICASNPSFQGCRTPLPMPPAGGHGGDGHSHH